MKNPDEYEILERAHEAAGVHMMQKSPRADELIACLEGEIAKRDTRIVELDDLVLSLQCKVIERDGELDAIKAQEPVAWYTEDHLDDKYATTYSWTVAERWVEKGWPVSPLYAAQVSEAKAQGVVMPERLKPSRYEIQDARADAWNSCLDEVARLNAAPAAPAADASHVFYGMDGNHP